MRPMLLWKAKECESDTLKGAGFCLATAFLNMSPQIAASLLPRLTKQDLWRQGDIG